MPNPREYCVGPIHPDEVELAKATAIPDMVFRVFNDHIVRNFSSNRAFVVQEDVVKDLVAAGFTRQEIIDNHWLDVESSYRAMGWRVSYDKPGYNESYAAKFCFTKDKS